ncbi:MAG: Na(+)-translocating NADH-quinone reductase subunit A [Rhodobacteraceae bacterium]|nr:Na(+)-translocating NADH-quinone reductase subunit A [Paracoccaceae bacterium]
MQQHVLKKGLDLPILGAPDQAIREGAHVGSVALVGPDYTGLKPKMLVAEGDSVRRGDPLFCDKDSPEVIFTAPASGTVTALNRGARRVLQSVVITISDNADAGVDFGAVDVSTAGRAAIADRLLRSGLWTAFRTRPYSQVPPAGSKPAAIFVTAVDTEPLAADTRVALSGREDDLALGLTALSALTEGTVYLCQDTGAPLVPEVPGIEIHGFEGPHPAGLAGTHIHFLEPPSSERTVWTIGAQDAVEIGTLLRTGFLDPSRVIALSGPRATDPRLLRTMRGASINDLIHGEILEPETPCRVISGSVLSGRLAEGPFAYLGRFSRQITLITEDHDQLTLGWILPQPNRFAVQPVLASSLFSGKLFNLTSNLNGGRRAMVPTGVFETLMPQDYLPTQLLRALLVKDTDVAQALGALELDEEDVALCAFACPAKYEYGEALRASLIKIEKEG